MKYVIAVVCDDADKSDEASEECKNCWIHKQHAQLGGAGLICMKNWNDFKPEFVEMLKKQGLVV